VIIPRGACYCREPQNTSKLYSLVIFFTHFAMNLREDNTVSTFDHSVALDRNLFGSQRHKRIRPGYEVDRIASQPISFPEPAILVKEREALG
jgi:hypothetical protein